MALDPLCDAVMRAYQAGIIVVAAAGNAGKLADGTPVLGGIASPGNSPFAITVGAITPLEPSIAATIRSHLLVARTDEVRHIANRISRRLAQVISLEAHNDLDCDELSNEHVAGSARRVLRMSARASAAPMSAARRRCCCLRRPTSRRRR